METSDRLANDFPNDRSPTSAQMRNAFASRCQCSVQPVSRSSALRNSIKKVFEILYIIIAFSYEQSSYTVIRILNVILEVPTENTKIYTIGTPVKFTSR